MLNSDSQKSLEPYKQTRLLELTKIGFACSRIKLKLLTILHEIYHCEIILLMTFFKFSIKNSRKNCPVHIVYNNLNFISVKCNLRKVKFHRFCFICRISFYLNFLSEFPAENLRFYPLIVEIQFTHYNADRFLPSKGERYPF